MQARAEAQGTTRAVVGTRGSKLALVQTSGVIAQLKRIDADLDIQMTTVRTEGDILHTASLAQIGGTGVFVKEIEAALLAGEIDLAVHSLKDLPVQQPAGLCIGAICQREDPHDVLLSNHNGGLDALPAGVVVGTGSLRRRAQVLAYRPDLEVRDIRGNVDTRLRKLHDGEYDAIVLAAAGLKRLGHTVTEQQYLPFETVLPAVGQGALAIEMRTGDERIARLIAPLNDPPTQVATQAEAAFLAAFGGGCAIPLGAYAEVADDVLTLQGMVSSPDGRRLLRERMIGAPQAPATLGTQLAHSLLARGAGEIIAEVLR